MSEHTEDFSFHGLGELIDKTRELGLQLPFSEDLSPLARPAALGNRTAPNRLAVQPMEGCDGTADGSPGELTIRRYDRFADGGAGLIWLEAVSVCREGRANPRQLYIHDDNWEDFARLAQRIRRRARAVWGGEPLLIIQLTHSGRFSRPEPGPLRPVLAYHSEPLDRKYGIDADAPIVTDAELQRLEQEFARAAALTKKAGFDGVDIKGCHRYLNSSLLSAYDRPGLYGGSFENRTRFFRNLVAGARDAAGGNFLVTTRINLYDGIEPWPKAWGMDERDPSRPDLAEPVRLLREFAQGGMALVNVTMGTPYFNPHVNRPFNRGEYAPPEHPLVGVARMMEGVRGVRAAIPQLGTIATGYSYLRQFAPHLAAGMVRDDWTTLAGFGRMAFAYPDFARDILTRGALDPAKVCIACSMCTTLMRMGGTAGCPVRDAGVYAKILSEAIRKGAQS